MAKAKKNKNTGEEVALEMTPMIDVVFQLLIFFIVTLKQDDILSSLEALRPAPDSKATPDNATEPVTILIGRTGFVFNGRPMSEKQLTDSFVRLAKGSKDTMIMIKCTDDSPHGYLVRALDILASVGLYKVSVFSM